VALCMYIHTGERGGKRVAKEICIPVAVGEDIAEKIPSIEKVLTTPSSALCAKLNRDNLAALFSTNE
jgi:hypothetical protein